MLQRNFIGSKDVIPPKGMWSLNPTDQADKGWKLTIHIAGLTIKSPVFDNIELGHVIEMPLEIIKFEHQLTYCMFLPKGQVKHPKLVYLKAN